MSRNQKVRESGHISSPDQRISIKQAPTTGFVEELLLLSVIESVITGNTDVTSIISPTLFKNKINKRAFTALTKRIEYGEPVVFERIGSEHDEDISLHLSQLKMSHKNDPLYNYDEIKTVTTRLLLDADFPENHDGSSCNTTSGDHRITSTPHRLYPAQDFLNGVLYYAVEVGGRQCLFSSKKEVIPFQDCQKHGFRLTTDEVDFTGFSNNGFQDFLNGRGIPEIHHVYDQLLAYFSRYIFFRDPDVYALLPVWVMGTYIFRVFDYFPYLHPNGEKGSGKSVLLDALSRVAFNADLSVESSPAVIYREIERNGSTLLLDEVESMRKGDQERNNIIMGILKSGFHRSGIVKRMGGKNFTKVEKYSTYSPKVLAGIRELDDVLQDRTIRIPMVRNTSSEKRERFITSQENLKKQASLRDNLYLFGLSVGPEIAAVYQEDRDRISGLDHLSGREYDIWAPIILIANAIDASRGDGVLTVTEALVRHSKRVYEERVKDNERENDTVKILQVMVQFLADEEPVSEENGVKEYLTQSVWEYFKAQDDFEWMNSKTMLTRLLRRVEIRTKAIRHGGKTQKVYLINEASLRDFFCRYAPSIPSITETQTEITLNA